MKCGGLISSCSLRNLHGKSWLWLKKFCDCLSWWSLFRFDEQGRGFFDFVPQFQRPPVPARAHVHRVHCCHHSGALRHQAAPLQVRRWVRVTNFNQLGEGQSVWYWIGKLWFDSQSGPLKSYIMWINETVCGWQVAAWLKRSFFCFAVFCSKNLTDAWKVADLKIRLNLAAMEIKHKALHISINKPSLIASWSEIAVHLHCQQKTTMPNTGHLAERLTRFWNERSWFNSRVSYIRHCVANNFPPLWHFFEKDRVAQKQWWIPQTGYMFQSNTASKVLISWLLMSAAKKLFFSQFIYFY